MILFLLLPRKGGSLHPQAFMTSCKLGAFPHCGVLGAHHPALELSPGLRAQAALSISCLPGLPSENHTLRVSLVGLHSPLQAQHLFPPASWHWLPPHTCGPFFPPNARIQLGGQTLHFSCLWSNTIWEGDLDLPSTHLPALEAYCRTWPLLCDHQPHQPWVQGVAPPTTLGQRAPQGQGPRGASFRSSS